MITVKKKNICIEIDGKDVETLSDICEIARRYLNDNKHNRGFHAEFGEGRVREIPYFMSRIFDL